MVIGRSVQIRPATVGHSVGLPLPRFSRPAPAAARVAKPAPIHLRAWTLPAEGYRLTGISSKAYEHPADRAATAALATIPYLDRSIRRLIDLGYERAHRRSSSARAVRLGEDQLPEVWRTHNRAYATLDLDRGSRPVPDPGTRWPTP